MLCLLDTSALLAHYRREQGSEIVQALFESEDTEVATASPVLTEFARRVRVLGVEEHAVLEVLDGYRTLMGEVWPVDEPAARAAILIAWRSPLRVPLVDALIAGVSSSRGAILVHRDEHFRGIPQALMRQLDLLGENDTSAFQGA